MLVVLSLCFLMSGLAALALSMDRHHLQVFRHAPARRSRITLRVAALALLAASLALAVIDMGAPVGITFWTALISPCALAVVFAQSRWQKTADPVRGRDATLGKETRP